MRACIIQPPYSRDVSDSDKFFAYKLNMLDQCDETVDLIVLPEYSDVPCATTTKEETLFYHHKYIGPLLDKCAQTARRCGATVFVNALFAVDGNYRNTTYVIDRKGQTVGKYFKKHLPPGELKLLELDPGYTREYSEPYVLELDGLRYGFLTCYDFYFYEAYAAIARQNVDVIVGCSLQRSDSHDAIEIMCRFLAYNTNAYVVRSSVSFDEESDICGASMVVSPYGKVLENMRGKFGMAVVEFDPKDKYYKPAGYGNPPAPHYAYIECGRNPWQYRFGGSAIVNDDTTMPYPRICAHRQWDAAAPENTMAAFGAAVAVGAQEVSVDLRSDEVNAVETILRKLSGHGILNIRMESCAEETLKKIVALIRQFGCEKYTCFMAQTERQVSFFKAAAPEIAVCLEQSDAAPMEAVDRAAALGCQKIELRKEHLHRELIEKAHANGIRCGVFAVDDPEEAKACLELGVDTIVTNDYQRLCRVISK